MGIGEFDLIRRYFEDLTAARTRVGLGVGDDCALLSVPAGKQLAVSTDALVAGVHFTHATAPADIGYKALAVNLSDLAAMGAEPLWATLTLCLPSVDEDWIKGFCQGFGALADAHGVALVGGDMSRGPLTIAVQIMGSVAPGGALRRSGANPGDLVYVTGTLGDAAAGLGLAGDDSAGSSEDRRFLVGRLLRPEPRVAAGRALAGQASAAIDISDGLCQDLGHLLRSSGCGASLELDRLPISPPLRRTRRLDTMTLALYGGDDYELCFTLEPDSAQEVCAAGTVGGVPVTRIGVLEKVAGLRGLHADGRHEALTGSGYRHF